MKILAKKETRHEATNKPPPPPKKKKLWVNKWTKSSQREWSVKVNEVKNVECRILTNNP